MSCGKRPLVKLWDKPKNIRVITPSRYEQNEASVKRHWKNVVKALEDSYKDEQFWETNCDTVRELVGPIIFPRIAKMYNLPLQATKYEPKSETSSTIIPSEQFYVSKSAVDGRPLYSMSSFEAEQEEEEEEVQEEESEVWTASSVVTSSELKKKSKQKSAMSSKTMTISKSLSKLLSKSFSRCFSRELVRSASKAKSMKSSEELASTPDSSADTADDVIVQHSIIDKLGYRVVLPPTNPHFEMLYCNESETDMIKWESKYKQKQFEISASDEFSKRAEILTKKIAKEFFDWWTALGSVEFKSEIKRPEDIEALFQVWFDEHASRGLMLNPKILPCVLPSIAKYTGARQKSCRNALKRQVAYDVVAETSPAHVMAFGTSLPHKMKHIPPKNNTKETWHSVRIPEDLRTMSAVWDDISHLTSTKAFQQWLSKHPQLPMPPFLKTLNDPGDKKALFVVPSDFFVKEGRTSGTPSAQELALPVSQFSLELKQVLSKLMNE